MWHLDLDLVRHGEQVDAGRGLPDGPLSPRGKHPAAALAKRLGGVPFDAAHTSPLQRAVETAEIITEHLPSVAPKQTTLLFDCVSSGESPEMPTAYAPFFGGVTKAEIEAGVAQMATPGPSLRVDGLELQAGSGVNSCGAQRPRAFAAGVADRAA